MRNSHGPKNHLKYKFHHFLCPGLNLDDGTISLPVKFKAPQVGHYTCRIVLRSPNDIRLYHLEVSVSPEGTTAMLEFSCPAQQSVIQDIPIVNNTDTNWLLQAFLKGESFSGPQTMSASANQTTLYPLTFKPLFEGATEGTLRLVNKTDGMEHCFSLSGFGERPLALDHINVNCTVKRKTGYMVKLPNTTSRKQTFNVRFQSFYYIKPRAWKFCVGNVRGVRWLESHAGLHFFHVCKNEQGQRVFLENFSSLCDFF